MALTGSAECLSITGPAVARMFDWGPTSNISSERSARRRMRHGFEIGARWCRLPYRCRYADLAELNNRSVRVCLRVATVTPERRPPITAGCIAFAYYPQLAATYIHRANSSKFVVHGPDRTALCLFSLQNEMGTGVAWLRAP